MPIPSILWLVALIALVVVEAATVGLVSLWFALGSLAALITSFFVHNIWVQFGVFLVVSLVSLLVIRIEGVKLIVAPVPAAARQK